ncbi:hypothetical protein STEG23_007987 [Scotinomys teguina]
MRRMAGSHPGTGGPFYRGSAAAGFYVRCGWFRHAPGEGTRDSLARLPVKATLRLGDATELHEPRGKPAENDVKLGALKLKPNTKIMMMGTREESLEDVLCPPPDNDDVINDFDIEDEVVEVENREENLLKISRRVKEYKVEVLNPPREGKKLLVLDVDYTLFAATNMKWIEAKMKELGVSTNANYKITFMLDSAAMITVHTPRRGLIDVKPLGVIWGKFSEFYSKKNTIMFDDIGRNFLMNPQNGLKIRPFMKAHLNRDKDKELVKLTQYLKEIAKLDDFLELNHKYWERFKRWYLSVQVRICGCGFLFLGYSQGSNLGFLSSSSSSECGSRMTLIPEMSCSIPESKNRYTKRSRWRALTSTVFKESPTRVPHSIVGNGLFQFFARLLDGKI